MFAACATLAFSAPAFAAPAEICIPTMIMLPGTEVPTIIFCPPTDGLGGTPPPPVVQVAPVIPPAPVVVVIPVPTLDPAILHDNRPFVCHYESTVGFSGPRRSNDLFKDLAKPGNTAVGADGLCAKPSGLS